MEYYFYIILKYELLIAIILLYDHFTIELKIMIIIIIKLITLVIMFQKS